jgi:predicted RNA methylase
MYQHGKEGQKILATSRADRDGSNNNIFTPLWVAKKMYQIGVDLLGRPPKSILEPCCGEGHILAGISEDYKGEITAVDIDENFLSKVRSKYSGQYNTWIWKYNFLAVRTDVKYDLILMNPPFSERDINSGTTAFMEKAYEQLTINGVLISVVPDYYIVNSEHRKRWLNDKLLRVIWLPKMTFGRPLWIAIIILRQPEYIKDQLYWFEPAEEMSLFGVNNG